MTEFELHQLALVSRYEFDIATVVYMAWTVVFLFLCRDRTERWSRGLGLSVAALYVIGCALIAVRCIAAMNRYGKELALLAKHPSIAIIMNPIAPFHFQAQVWRLLYAAAGIWLIGEPIAGMF